MDKVNELKEEKKTKDENTFTTELYTNILFIEVDSVTNMQK